MIRSHSQNLRPNPKTEAHESVLALRLKEALEKAKAKKRQPEEAG